MDNASSETLRCSFCGLLKREVDHMLKGPGPLYICDQCVDLAVELITESKEERQALREGSRSDRPVS